MAAPAVEKLPKRFRYVYCWICGQPGHLEGPLLCSVTPARSNGEPTRISLDRSTACLG